MSYSKAGTVHYEIRGVKCKTYLYYLKLLEIDGNSLPILMNIIN